MCWKPAEVGTAIGDDDQEGGKISLCLDGKAQWPLGKFKFLESAARTLQLPRAYCQVKILDARTMVTGTADTEEGVL